MDHLIPVWSCDRYCWGCVAAWLPLCRLFCGVPFFTVTSTSRSPLLRVRAAVVVVVASNFPGVGGDPPLWGGITPGVKLSRPPLEGEVVHTVSGVGLGVVPPRKLVLTNSHWTNLNPSSSAMGAVPRQDLPGHSHGRGGRRLGGDIPPSDVCHLEVCGIL